MRPTITGEARAALARPRFAQRAGACLLVVTLVWLDLSAAAAQDQAMQETEVVDIVSAPAAEPSRWSQLHGRVIFAGLLMIPRHERGELAGGFQIGGGIAWGKLPLLLGLDFGFTAGAKERYRSRLEELPDLSLEVTRQDLFYFATGWLRLQPMHWRFVQPYLEGFAGIKLLQTEYTVAFVSGEDATSTTEAKDWTPSVGWGMGLDLPLSHNVQSTLFLTLGLRRLYSPDAVFSQTTSRGTRAMVRVPMDGWMLSVGLAGGF